MEITDGIKELAESFPFGFTIWQRKGDRLYCVYRNASSEKLTGIKKEEFLGKEFYTCYPDAPESYKERFFKVLDRGTVWRVDEFRFFTKTKKALYRLTSFRINDKHIGVIIENLQKCKAINRDGTSCPNMASLGNFCMKHAMTQLKKKSVT